LRKQKQALATHNRAEIGIVGAQIRQASAALELAEEQLARTQIVAPTDGLVVSGDLSQSLGAPVEKGEVLFELAPEDSFRAILNVDERDAAYVTVGQTGWLSLASAPNRKLPIEISRITPVTVAEDEINALEIEAQLSSPLTGLQPGMEGVAKIESGERRLLWIWTHGITDRLRLAAWKYLP
jgi:multidrug resistance efflux pump